MATRWDPFRDLMTIQNELNQLFGRTYGGREQQSEDTGAVAWVPPIDIYETDQAFVVELDLAGVRPEDVDITVEESTLTVRGERRLTEGVPEQAFHRVERRYGSFARSIVLPPTANQEGIDASFDRGVLTVTVPKAEQAKPRKIEVKATG